MGQIGEGIRWTAGILPEWETRRGQAGRLRYVLPRLGLHVSSMAERSISIYNRTTNCVDGMSVTSLIIGSTASMNPATVHSILNISGSYSPHARIWNSTDSTNASRSTADANRWNFVRESTAFCFSPAASGFRLPASTESKCGLPGARRPSGRCAQ